MMTTGDILGDLPPAARQNRALTLVARIISYVFHPLFIPVYVALFVIYELRLFSDRGPLQHKFLIAQFVLNYTFLPLVTVLLCKGLGFIQSIHLKTQKDRIIPYILCEIFYFWTWYVFHNQKASIPAEVEMFALGVFLATSAGLILNAYLKVSMHALSMGVLCAFIMLASLMSFLSFGLYISIAFLIAGLTCTARLLDSNHTTQEIYLGFFTGALVQVIAYFFV